MTIFNSQDHLNDNSRSSKFWPISDKRPLRLDEDLESQYNEHLSRTTSEKPGHDYLDQQKQKVRQYLAKRAKEIHDIDEKMPERKISQTKESHENDYKNPKFQEAHLIDQNQQDKYRPGDQDKENEQTKEKERERQYIEDRREK
ncbi:UNKNOWN [Stylonychia lemnae]|uniref:Uncharacterized protein n=1 Tax=Stylonychia lemnae TaxID=5949 RepID=A0A078AQN7_STYLE|nr:UNKNOWN [Stylonychia lemnae]|eukprot:CDW83557.1 UNKNOWN [Stylonychia lemnae]